MAKFIDVCEQAARIGGQVVQSWVPRFQAREKGPADLVTEADFAAQEAIRDFVLAAFPGHDFLGEEETDSQASAARIDLTASNPLWIVDPLDGTTNYAHRLPHYAVSIAIAQNGLVQAGVVYDPVADECFKATRGGGAWLNDQPIKASDETELACALVAASLPASVRRDSAAIQNFLTIIERVQAIRRQGCSSLNLCNVAAGRVDAYWATDTKVWDVAAGWLIVEEAGGVVTALDGTRFSLERPFPAAAATAELNRRLVGIFQGS